MLARLQDFTASIEAGVQVRAIRAALRRRRHVVRQRVVVEPRNAVGRARHEMQLTIGNVGRATVLRVPFRRAPVGVHQSRGGREPGERHVRCDVRRDGHRVDGHVEAAPLQLSRGGQADGAAPDDGRAPFLVRGGKFRRHQAGAPRQRHSRAAMTVVVNQQAIVELVCLEHEPGITMRAQPHGRANDAVPGRIHAASAIGPLTGCPGGGRRTAQPPSPKPTAARPDVVRKVRRFMPNPPRVRQS